MRVAIHIPVFNNGLYMSLEEPKEFLLGFVIDSGRLVVLGHLGRNRPSAATGAGPIQPFSYAKNGDRLFLLVSTFGVALVALEPSGLFDATNIRVIPRPSTLHVGDIFGTNFTL